MTNITPINPATGLPYAQGGAVPGSPQAPGPQYMPHGSCTQGIPGQCTELVAQTYPILNKVPCMGNACQWWAAAGKWGWYSSNNPYVGAIAVWDCSLPGSGGAGHVAVVKTVNSDGTFVVAEENWLGVGRLDTRTVNTKSHISGFFSPPGGPVPGSALSPGGSAGPVTGPATGARGLRCQFSVQIPSIPLVAGQSLGPWAVCLDGLIGVLAVAGGVGIIVLAAVLAVRKPAERAGGRAAEAVGVATGQPEVAMAGRAAEAEGARTRPQTARRRPVSATRMSVQEQETRRHLIATGYSAVQAERGARAAGSTGNAQERLTRGLRALAPA